jgi:methionine aminopeptidase
LISPAAEGWTRRPSVSRSTPGAPRTFWTVATVDDALAAHLGHTIAITANGPEILTQV